MALFDKFEKWSEKYHAPWMGILRIILGVILTVKGFMFIVDTSTLVRILTNSFGVTNGVFVAHIIAILHLFTGFLILIGLATRICCLVEIPVLLGAIFFVNLNTKGGGGVLELIFSIVVLFLLVFFFLIGSGRFSAYYYLINSKRSRLTDESDDDYEGGSPVAPLDKDANIL
ncbi:MAG: DoxX family protein [Chitinophagales bacterium]|jgi:uncharacterized membrane protein YphA (DoxX/SURF4 family)|nr:DoxX family protein [Chitinophagales bacterium]